MVLLKIDRGRDVPYYRQIIQQVVDLIEKNSIPEGEALPATRVLAESLGVDRTTVYRAYLELAALGYVESHPGSYTRIRKRVKIAKPASRKRKAAVNWAEQCAPESDTIYQFFRGFKPETASMLPADFINLSPLDMDHRLFPAREFRRCLNQVMVNSGAKILRYGDYQGYLPLREDISQRMQIHGVSVSPGEILITNGAQQAIELVLKCFSRPGKKVAIESPTYANVIPLIRFHRMEIQGIPMSHDGMDLASLYERAREESPQFIYTIPNFQNPTGITTSQAHREKLLRLSETYRIPLVEDGFEEEMKYFGKTVLPIKSMDDKQLVIYLGTYSKVLFPGIRVGWIAGDEALIQRLVAIKRFSDLSGSTLLQSALSAFIRNGYYDMHLKRMHRFFRKRMSTALAALKENMPPDITWTRPEGGYTIWLRLPEPFSNENYLKQVLIKNGVLASPGIYYFHTAGASSYLRLSISTLDEVEIAKGIGRLGNALEELLAAGA